MSPKRLILMLLTILGLGTLGLGAAVFLGPGLLLLWVTWNAPAELLRREAIPHSDLTLEITYLGPAFHPYGSHSVDLTIKRGDAVLGHYGTRLKNDGAHLSDQNVEVRWPTPQQGTVCLRGAEQTPAGLAIDLAATPIQFQPDATACQDQDWS